MTLNWSRILIMSDSAARIVTSERNRFGRITNFGLTVKASSSAVKSAPCVSSLPTTEGTWTSIAWSANDITLKKRSPQIHPIRRRAATSSGKVPARSPGGRQVRITAGALRAAAPCDTCLGALSGSGGDEIATDQVVEVLRERSRIARSAHETERVVVAIGPDEDRAPDLHPSRTNQLRGRADLCRIRAPGRGHDDRIRQRSARPRS